MQTTERPETYGILAEFTTAQQLYDALMRAKAEGYRALDAFSPFPVEEIAHEVADHKKSKVSLITLIAGLTGAAAGFGLQYFVSVIDYPLNIGGRPLNSWPAFIPVTFESAILAAGLGTVFVLLVRSRLFPWSQPKLAHPRMTHDRFVLAIRQTDADLDPGMAAAL